MKDLPRRIAQIEERLPVLPDEGSARNRQFPHTLVPPCFLHVVIYPVPEIPFRPPAVPEGLPSAPCTRRVRAANLEVERFGEKAEELFRKISRPKHRNVPKGRFGAKTPVGFAQRT